MTVFSRLAAQLVKLPPPQTTNISVERDLAAKMPDGTVLLADRWYPTDESGGRPTVLIRTPYGRALIGPLGRLYAERRYQVVIQSCRGTFGSEGDLVPVRHEQADGHATLEWVASQPWFDGRLVMWGASYLGMTQWAIAEDAPNFVKALNLQVTASKFRDAIVYPGESFALEMALCWLYQMKYQESGIGTVVRKQLGANRVVSRMVNVLPLGKADTATLGEISPAFQDWLEHNCRGTRGGTRSISGVASTKYPRQASSPAGMTSSCPGRSLTTRRCAAPAARPASRSVPGPTPARASSARASATGSTGSTNSSGSGVARSHGHPCGSTSWDPRRGRTSPCGRRRARNRTGTWAAGARSAPSLRPRAGPTTTTTTPTTRHRPWVAPGSTSSPRGGRTSAGESTGTTSSPTRAPSSPRI